MSDTVSLASEALSALMPMHIVVSPTGHVVLAGPTLARLCPGEALVGRRLLDLFEFRRPARLTSMADLLAQSGRRLSLQFRHGPRTTFRGVVVPLPDGAGAFLNLSFGIGAVAAVAEHQLTAADFAPTELTVEMLYLVEAKSAAMEESRSLNRRLEGARSAAEEQAMTDALTGLGNRRAMEEALAALTGARARFGLIHLDLDFFKAVNDTIGHAAGDAVLCAVAAVLSDEVREGDIAARTGGDEFLLIFPGVTDATRLATIAGRIITRIEEPVSFGAEECRISASAGIVVSTSYAVPEVERMLHDADQALYASKRAGRARATVFGEHETPREATTAA